MWRCAPNAGFDFGGSSQPLDSHSTSMSSTSSPRSGPQWSHGTDEFLAHPTSFTNPEHARNNWDASLSSTYSLDLIAPAPTHIRAPAPPYPRDAESVHSSSSEDISEYHSAQSSVNPQHHQPSHSSHHLSHHPYQHQHLSQQTTHVPGAFGSLPGPGAEGPGWMDMGAKTDHTLEKLAANVRDATTTSASDRAKQLFVQAWCVLAVLSLHFYYCPVFQWRLADTALSFFVPPLTGLLRTIPPTQTAMSHGRGSISLTEEFATSTEHPTSIPPLLAKPLDFFSPLSRPSAWAFGGIVDIVVSSTFHTAFNPSTRQPLLPLCYSFPFHLLLVGRRLFFMTAPFVS